MGDHSLGALYRHRRYVYCSVATYASSQRVVASKYTRLEPQPKRQASEVLESPEAS